LKRLFELGCAYSGQILSYTKLLGQIQDAGNTTTLAHYLNLLDATGLISGLEKYSHEKIRQRASSPKFQVQNNALFSVMCGRSFSQSIQQPSLWGRHIETAIGTHLLNASKTKQINIYYWRERNDEMDFVLEKNSKIIGIEVKSGNTEKKRGIEKFKQLVKPDHVYFISNSGLSWQEFLKMNVLDLF
jgi:hypothetical protein